MSEIRFGVIGLRRGQEFIRICQAVDGAAVAALYDIDTHRAEKTSSDIGARAFSDFDALLESDIDAVVVASPIPHHASQSIAAMAADKHVLSEVTACDTKEEARALVAACRASDRVYMMAENYRYLDEAGLLKRLTDDNRFGDVYYGEGEYLHDCRELWYAADGSLTWRTNGQPSVYCTHSIGPLLYITDDRVSTVSAISVPGGKYDPRVTSPTMHLMHLTTERGITLRVRVDHVSSRPHQMQYYALQGSAGSYEAWRGLGDASKVWLENAHGTSKLHGPASWRPLSDQVERYIPERLAAPPAARGGGHGTSEYWMVRDFLAAIRGEISSPIDVHRALDYTLPGICALESAAAGGSPVKVDDPRSW